MSLGALRLTAAIAVAANAALLWSRPAPGRALVLGAALIGFAWVGARRASERGTVERLILSLAICGAFWWAVLIVVLDHRTPFARGALMLLALAATHLAIVFGRASAGATARHTARVLLYALVFAAITLGTLAAIEALARALSPLRTYEIVPDDPAAGPCLVRHPDGRLVGRPGCSGRYLHREFAGVEVEINSLGLRDGLDEATPTAAGDRSVVVLGDSFAFGLGVALEETFHERLERALAAELGRPVRVYGAGMPGGGVIDERRMLEQIAPVARPDVVVLALFEGNDLQDTWSRRQALADDSPAAAPAPSAAEPALRFLAALAGSRFWLGSSSLLQLGRVDGRPTRVMEMALEAERPAAIEEMTAAMLAELGVVETVCERLGADLVVLLVPTILQAEPQRFEAFAARRPGGRFARTAFHRHLAHRLRDHGFESVDPLPRLEEESLAGRHCYHREGHWNARGHAIAAELLAPRLLQHIGRRASDLSVPGRVEAAAP